MIQAYFVIFFFLFIFKIFVFCQGFLTPKTKLKLETNKNFFRTKFNSHNNHELTLSKLFTVSSDQNFNSLPDRNKNAFFFPGQGSQFIGMGVDISNNLKESKELFSAANTILGYDIFEICKNGPKELLDSTEIAQPAIFVCSMAAVEKLKTLDQFKEQLDENSVALGLSLGEYSALCFTGSLNFEDALKLVQERGKAMQAAADSSEGSMVAILGLSSLKVKELCQYVNEKTNEPVSLANYLSPGNYVISGSKKACEYAEKIARPEFKALKAIRLAVAGAFHTNYMFPAANRLRKILDNTHFYSPSIPIISNVDAKAHVDPEKLKENLFLQLTRPVLWEDSMKSVLNDGLKKGFELGPGNVITGLMKRIDKSQKIEQIG